MRGLMHRAAAAAGLALAAAMALAGAAPALAAADGAPGGTWGTARTVPGLAALNQGGFAAIGSVSCASPGNCSAGGYYQDRSGHEQAFVVSEVHGTWGTAIEVPGTAALNQGGSAGIHSVSCASAGNCSADGGYKDSSGRFQVFVVSEVHGIWGTAEQVPGTGALNKGGFAFIGSVSCGAAGNCSADGSYQDRPGRYQVFVVSEVHGIWGTAEQVPGTGALNQGGDADTGSVSCASAGNCSTGGLYRTSSGNQQAFVVSQVHGTWGTAEQVPGTAALNQGGGGSIGPVSCASAGTCSAGGSYIDSSGHSQVFVVSQVHGTWGTAIEVPGTAALSQGGDDSITSVSCGRAGTCGAGGWYADSSGNEQAFVVSQAHGTWRTAEQVPGTAALNQGGNAEIFSVSCARAGTCSAGGYYQDSSGNYQAFVVSQVHGT